MSVEDNVTSSDNVDWLEYTRRDIFLDFVNPKLQLDYLELHYWTPEQLRYTRKKALIILGGM
jgi:hypothetical protein